MTSRIGWYSAGSWKRSKLKVVPRKLRTVPEEPESGMFYIYDRARQTFFMVDLAEAGRYGGYRLEEFEQMAQTFGLKALAQNPRTLAGTH